MLLTVTILSFIAAVICAALAWRVTRDERARSAARVAALARAIDGEPASAATTVAPAATPIGGSPMIKIAAIGTMALVMGAAVALPRGSSGSPAGTAPSAAALELMSMRHEADRSAFTVTGLVRNPRAGAPVDHLAAVVFAFDAKGNFISSARAPIDFRTLGPGDESPFVVTVPKAAGVSRYRVTFRSDTGVIRHVDNRGQA